MATSFRQQALIRKVTYAGLIVLLFSILVAYRQLGIVEHAAERYDIAETSLGEVDLGGSAARFALACFRGPLITLLWWEAIELQAKHDWPEMELRIKALSKLQPHFREPWKYQGWNLAFNVSVEFDNPVSKYFHISQGINWVAEGERKNRKQVHDPVNNVRKEVGDPDLRWNVGFFLYDKMTVSDEVSYFRCYLPLSCIPPREWDPYDFRQNPGRLREFKETYPQLARRIASLKSLPEDAEAQADEEILRFLAALRKTGFPSLYPDQLAAVKAAALGLPNEPTMERFPVWPDAPRLNPADKHREEVHSPYAIAWNWYEYSLEPLTPPGVDMENLDPRQRHLYRRPKNMASLIFRANPPRTKSHQGRALYKEGWFKEGQAAWQEAYEAWLAFGLANGLELPQEEMDALEAVAEAFRKRYPDIAAEGNVPGYRRDDKELMAGFEAYLRYSEMQNRRGLANFVYWRIASEFYAKPDAVQARRHWYNAGKALKTDLQAAKAEFEKGIPHVKKLIVVPRPVQGTDLRFLLSVGPEPVMNVALAGQPTELFKHTPFGNERLIQEEILELQDEYRSLKVRADTTRWLQATHQAWEMSQALGRGLVSPAALGAPAAMLPSGTAPTTMNWVEAVLLQFPAPLDTYLDPRLVGSRRGRTMPETPPALPPGAEVIQGGAPANVPR